MESSVGSRGDSYDNAMAETINGLYKAELIHKRGPWKTVDKVGSPRLGPTGSTTGVLGPIGDIPPAEFEAAYFRQETESAMVA
jgi:putative transposase